MVSKKFCPYDAWTTPYLAYGICLGILIPLQLLICFTTFKYECARSKNQPLFAIKKPLTYSFVALVITGLYWYIIDLFRFLIDAQTSFVQDNRIFCTICAYSPKLLPFIFFTLVFYQLIYRLEISFRGSCFELSKKLRIFIYCLTYIPSLIIIPPLWIYFLPTSCRWKWEPSDFRQWNNISFCDVALSGINEILLIICIIWVVMDNILICIIFTWKLRQMLSLNDLNTRYDTTLHLFKIKAVMIKNAILVISASISTFICWLLWLFISNPLEIGGSFLYLDLFLNCWFISLMFSYNDKNYKKYCKFCIRLCFRYCDKSINEDNVERREIQLRLYLNDNDYHKFIQFF